MIVLAYTLRSKLYLSGYCGQALRSMSPSSDETLRYTHTMTVASQPEPNILLYTQIRAAAGHTAAAASQQLCIFISMG
jgi:hypothetical protein